ncbi:MAG TPA: hypothetical protein VGJ54_01100, partial [Streptosporangiaceae bacterium]
WPGYALFHQPADFWQGNTFFPEPDTFAFTDSMLGYAPLSLIGHGPAAAMVRYNIVYVLIAIIAFLGAYALARQLGARWPGAVVAGAAFAYAPWRLAHASHPNVLSVGGMALALAALARGHGYSFRDGYQPDRVRPGWAAVGWGIACWQVMIGFAVGLPVVYILALICVVAGIGWLVAGRPRLPRRLLVADGVGGVFFALTGGLIALPYLQVAERHPEAIRGEADLKLFSPPFRGFFTAPQDSWFWGDLHANARATLFWLPEMTLLPGAVVAALAVMGLISSSWTVRQRLALAAATVASVVLALGTTLAGGKYTYLPLLHHLPGWDGLRTPGRLVIWTTLALGLLAAGAVTRIGDDLTAWRSRREPGEQRQRWPVWVTALLLLPGLLVLGEGVNNTAHPTVPPEPAAIRDIKGPALVLPTEHFFDMAVMFWSTDGFPVVTNGSSSFNPATLYQTREITKTFPDVTSVDHLRRLGVHQVVLLTDHVAGTPWQDAAQRPVDGLPLRRTETKGAIVYTLDPS